ncbi:MAG: hypothetical protein OEW35_18795 [Gammaproteobacteria bacterium]|nr:hypothetical protein [Gammaproteobacteria bacterium]MDH4256409.1 hypothetical protein [Gammaproteobacteria bacterium]MDH5311102.1 hypothetical protein [Gammaproteobacteria bacterium]
MSRSLKAPLLSALVFPGLGHLVLRHYFRAAVLIVVALGALEVYGSVTVDRAMGVLDQVYSGEISADPASISAAVTAASSGPDETRADIALLVMAACWLAGIVDSYRLSPPRDLQ